MPRSLFQWRSLKTKISLATLAIFLASIWSLSLYASRILREDMQRQLGEQQLATVAMVATQINSELKNPLSGTENRCRYGCPYHAGRSSLVTDIHGSACGLANSVQWRCSRI